MTNTWGSVRLEDIATVERGKFSVRPRNDPRYYGGDIPFLQTGDVASATGVVKSYTQTLNREGLKVSKLFPAGTLLLTIAANIGDIAEVGFDFACPDSLVAIQPNNGVDKSWLKYFLQTQKSHFESHATQNAQANINLQTIRPLMVPLPPLSEQIAISALLATWDAAIDKTVRLIAAKERRFKGLVQRLVVTPYRTKGYWKHLRIRDIAKRIQRRTNGDVLPILTIASASGFVLQEEKYSRYMAGESVKNYILLRKGEFAYNKGNSLRYQFGCVFELKDYEVALVPHVYVCFRLNEGIDPSYLGHLFEADYLKRQLGAIVKTGIRNNGLLNIKPDEFMDVTVPIPPLAQQQHIAETLNTAKQEIDLLKNQAEAFRKQKRGLMQKLLTGVWRVRVSSDQHGLTATNTD